MSKKKPGPKTPHGKTSLKAKRTEPQKRFKGVDKKAINEGVRYFWKKRGIDVADKSQWDK